MKEEEVPVPQQGAAPEYEKDIHSQTPSTSDDGVGHLLGAKSLGVQRIEAISAHFTTVDRWVLFLGIFLVSYCYGLDGTIRYTYQPIAAASLDQHSLLATIAVVRGVMAAACQPVAAKIADVFGRVELVMISIVLYVVGTIVEAAADTIAAFAAGAVLYQLGFTVMQLLVEVLIADLTSLRSRLFFSYIPAAPFIINTWVSGNVTEAVLGVTTWRWGIGMFAIIYPVCTLPLLITLIIAGRRADKAGGLQSFKTPFQTLGFKQLSYELFFALDIVGCILIIAVLGLILTPLTLAGGYSTSWQSGSIIAPVVIGVCCIPAFIIWEMKCKHPLIPFHLLKDRGVWGALGIAVFLNTSWYLQGDYLYTVVSIAFDQSILSATRITSLYSFVSVITGLIVGLIVRQVRYLKPFVIAGTCLFMVAFGLLIRYRGGTDGANLSGMIGAQVLLGIAGGLFPYTAQASIQAATIHEHVAVITGLYLSVYYIGSALGNCISGAIWTQVLPGKLSSQLALVTSNSTLPAIVYGDPFSFAAVYPVGTPERTAVNAAYMDTQKILCIVGICLSVFLIIFGACLRNPKLGNEQSLPDAEKKVGDVSSETGEVITGDVKGEKKGWKGWVGLGAS